MDEGWLGHALENSAEILVDLRRSRTFADNFELCSAVSATFRKQRKVVGLKSTVVTGCVGRFLSGMSGRVGSFFDGWLHALKAQRTESGPAYATNKAEGKSLSR